MSIANPSTGGKNSNLKFNFYWKYITFSHCFIVIILYVKPSSFKNYLFNIIEKCSYIKFLGTCKREWWHKRNLRKESISIYDSISGVIIVVRRSMDFQYLIWSLILVLILMLFRFNEYFGGTYYTGEWTSTIIHSVTAYSRNNPNMGEGYMSFYKTTSWTCQPLLITLCLCLEDVCALHITCHWLWWYMKMLRFDYWTLPFLIFYIMMQMESSNTFMAQ